jgi:hypothetical protein
MVVGQVRDMFRLVTMYVMAGLEARYMCIEFLCNN